MNHWSDDLEQPQEPVTARVYLVQQREDEDDLYLCWHCAADQPGAFSLPDYQAHMIAATQYCDDCGEEFY